MVETIPTDGAESRTHSAATCGEVLPSLVEDIDLVPYLPRFADGRLDYIHARNFDPSELEAFTWEERKAISKAAGRYFDLTGGS